MSAPQTIAPARPAAPRQTDDAGRRSRVQAARTAAPAAPLADWAQRQAQGAGPRVALGAPGGVVELKGKGTFAPPDEVAAFLARQRRPAPVDVRFGALAAGPLHVRRRGDRYDTDGLEAIPLIHPALDALADAGVVPVLAIAIRNSAVTGHVSIAQGRRGTPAGPGAILDAIRGHSAALGWIGLGDLAMPSHANALSAGTLALRADLRFGLGGFLKGAGHFGLADEAVSFEAEATATVAGLARIALNIVRRPDGTLEGTVEVPVTYKHFSGHVLARFAGGVVDVTGTGRYDTDKLSGEATLQVTDAATAREVAKRLLPPSAVRADAAQAAGAAPGSRSPAPSGPRPGPRAVVGWGTLRAHFSDWLSGSATVIVDGAGQVTVVGTIAPPAVVPLFKAGVRRRIFEAKPSFGFGVPYVARGYIGADIWLDVFAYVDGRLQQIEINGIYSTDPAIFNEFSISATLLIGAVAGLQGLVGVEGGIELLGHDVSVGAGIKLTAGLLGKVEARPTIAYKEVADPAQGRRGVFSIAGYLEIAAQPFVGIGGTAWIKLSSPWWSPAPNRTWPKDLFNKEYLLGGPFGFGTDFEYVLGSGEYPQLKPREPHMDGSALMSDVMDDNVASGAHSSGSVPATWKEKARPPAPPAPAPAPRPRGPSTTRPEHRQTPRPEHQKRWNDGMRELGALTREARARPLTQGDVERRLGALRARYGFTRLEAKAAGADWEIYARLGDATNEERPAKARRAPGPGALPAPSAPSPAPAKPVAADKRAERALLGVVERFEVAGGERHTLSFQRGDRRPLLIVSTTPVPLDAFVRSLRVPNPSPDRDFLLRLVERVSQLEDHALQTNTDTSAAIVGLLEEVGRWVARLMNRAARLDLRTTPPAYGGLFQGFGRGVRVTLVTNELGRGSDPQVGGGHFTALNLRRRGDGSFYVLGHLLSEKLGGRGDTWLNLTPISRAANSEHERRIESIMKPATGDTPRAFTYVLTVAYGRSLQTGLLAQIAAASNPDPAAVKALKARIVQAEQYVPTALVGTIRELDPLSGRHLGMDETYTVDVVLPQSGPGDYEL
jgi:hypothetical protein